ncbi:hypothetical protein F5Y06DRAFT_6675 [Hypoxylon sp. FL0890]|nr:hypothetical protein F5Y06DRAFT_6675 [Hypoxylon sp. FL0890]
MDDEIELQKPSTNGEGKVTEAVFHIFKDYLQTEGYSDSDQAAIRISRLASEHDKTLDDGFFFELWDSIFGIAEQLPYDHVAQDSVVQVMRELTLLPDTGKTVWGAHIWSGLPVLGAALRERLNRSRNSDVEEEQAGMDEAWVNFHAFSARLIGAGVTSIGNLPIWMLREALEEATPPDRHTADIALWAAAVYIEYSGPILVEALAGNPDPVLSDETDRRILRGGSLFKGEPGLRLERWLFWIERFKEEAEKTDSADTKEIALRAARLMEIWNEARLKKKQESRGGEIGDQV